jgi:hypothetical protein
MVSTLFRKRGDGKNAGDSFRTTIEFDRYNSRAVPGGAHRQQQAGDGAVEVVEQRGEDKAAATPNPGTSQDRSPDGSGSARHCAFRRIRYIKHGRPGTPDVGPGRSRKLHALFICSLL